MTSSPLWYLWSRTLGNAVRVRLRRLREPRYLLGAVLGFGWLGFVLWSNTRGLRWDQPPDRMRIAPEALFNPDLAALILGIALLALAWIVPASRAALAFTEAEAAWLFSAPLRRQQLVRYKLLSLQLPLLFTSLFVAVLTGRTAGVGGTGWARAVGVWLVLSLFQLHRVGASFALSRLYAAGLTDRRRRLLFVVPLALAAGVFAWRQGWLPALPAFGAPPTAASFPTAVTDWLHQLRGWAAAPPMGWILWPLRVVVAPWFARDAASFFLALGPALAVLALHYVWVTRSDVAFEEASAELAGRDAERIRRAQESGETRPRWVRGAARPAQALWALRPKGGVAAAFAWRAALEAGGRRRLGLFVIGGVALLVVGWFVRPATYGNMPRYLLTILGVQGVIITMLFLAPFATARKLGGELRHAAALKSAPITGRDVMRGRLWFTALGWSLVQLFSFAVMLLGIDLPARAPEMIPLLPAAFGAAVLVLAPANATAALLPSAAFLWLPAWFRTGVQRGPESTGVGILLFLSQILWLGVGLGGPVAAGVFVGWLLSVFIALPGAILLGALTAALPLALMGWFGAGMLGTFFDEYDPSREA